MLIVAFITTLLLSNTSQAAEGINKSVSFQARLLQANGAVVPDGYYNVQFKIYQDGDGTAADNTSGSPAGSLKWTESYVNNNSNSGLFVRNGFLSVSLGSVNPFGDSVDWNQDTLWLSMNIAGRDPACITFGSSPCTADGEMLPMKRITATPFALNAGRLGGLEASDFLQTTGSLQSGSTWLSGELRSDTGVLTPELDTATAGALGIGTANATSINIGQEGVVTNIQGGLTAANIDTASATAIEIGTNNATQINLNTDVVIADGKSLSVNGQTILRGSTSGGSTTYETSFENVNDINDFTSRGTTDSWSISNSDFHNGGASAASGSTPDGGISELSRTVTVTSGSELSFWWKVSSESGYDLLYYCIDDQLPTGGCSSGISSISGTGGSWAQVTRSLSAGTHTISWVYYKDGGGSHGLDKGWVDDIAITNLANPIPEDVLQVRDGGDGIVASIDAAGNLTAQSINIENLTVNGDTLIKSSTNSDTAFQVQDASGTTVLGVDTVTGDVTIDSLKALEIDAADGETLYIGNNTSDINLGTDVTLAAGKSLTITGGATGTRPASPTEGMMYFDTDTDQLIVYSNGKWQSDRTTTTKIIAAGNSTQSAKDYADFVGDGEAAVGTGTIDGDQVQINAAIDALPSTGGTIYLTEGTYYLDGSIVLPSNVKLSGAGDASVLTVNNSFGSAFSFITNETTSSPGNSAVTIEHIKLDGNRSNNGVTAIVGINFTYMGSGTGSSAVAGANINNTTFANFRGTTIWLTTSNNNTITDNTFIFDASEGVDIDTGVNNKITNNSFFSVDRAISFNATTYSMISNNTIDSSSSGNGSVDLAAGSSNNNIFGNTFRNNTSISLRIATSTNNIVSNNLFTDNGGSGSASALTIAGNADNNTISRNTFRDTAGTGHAINIDSANADGTYIDGNSLSGTGASTINDLGTNTIYGGQTSSGGNFVIRPASSIELVGATNVTGTLNATSVATSALDTATATTLEIGTTNATQINLNENVVVAAGKTLALVGGNTASRPVSPSEGSLYFDTDTDQLMVYANGKWKSDSSDAILVAASNSSQTDKDAAHYLANGDTVSADDGDQVQINAALTAAAGKKVVLLAGTYTIDASINVPNNTLLSGVGTNTLVQLADLDTTVSMIRNSDTSTGTGVTIQDMKLDGRDDLNTAGTQVGIYLDHIGDTTRAGATVRNVAFTDILSGGIRLANVMNSSVSTNSFNNISTNPASAIYATYSYGITFDNNKFMGNHWNLRLDGSQYNTIVNNVFYSSSVGITATGSAENTITGNSFGANYNDISFAQVTNTVVSSNTFDGNTYRAISIDTSSDNTISSNNFRSSGGTTNNNAIVITGDANHNTVIGNNITDSSATSTNYAINILTDTADANYLSDNILGSGSSIADAGTGTIYGGQIDSGGSFVIQPASTIELAANTNVAGVITASSVATSVLDTATATALSIGDTNATSINLGASTTVDGDLAISESASARTISVATRSSNAAGTDLTIGAGNAGSGANAHDGGTLALNGGDAAGAGTANGGDVVISGGSGVGSGGGGLGGNVIISGGSGSGANGSVSLSGSTLTLQSSSQTCTLTTSWSCTSDASLKTIQGDLTGGLDKILQLNPVYYTWNNDPSEHIELGLTAQDVQLQFPELVSADDNGTLSLNYQGLSAGIISAIKEQQQQLDSIDASISAIHDSIGTTSIQGLDDTSTTAVTIGDPDDEEIALLQLDRGASAPSGNHSDLLGSMYYDTTLGVVQCYEEAGWGDCGSKPDTFITISPEYTNAVMNGADIGTISSDLCSDTLNINDGSSGSPTICGTNETYNFYNWTSSEASSQTRSIYVTYKLPSTFDNFVAGSTSLKGRTDSTNSNITYQVYKDTSSGLVACGSAVSVSTGSQSTWQTGTASGSADPANCNFSAGDSILIRINLSAHSDANAYVSNIGFTFSNN